MRRPNRGNFSNVAEPTWITRAQAAQVLDVHPSTIGKYIDRGLLHRRFPDKTRHGKTPSVNLEEALALRERLLNERLENERAVLARKQEKERRRPHRGAMPPDDHEWLNREAAARLVGVSPAAISQRVSRGTIPSVLHNGTRFFRRDLIEQFARSRRVRLEGESALPNHQ